MKIKKLKIEEVTELLQLEDKLKTFPNKNPILKRLIHSYAVKIIRD